MTLAQTPQALHMKGWPAVELLAEVCGHRHREEREIKVELRLFYELRRPVVLLGHSFPWPIASYIGCMSASTVHSFCHSMILGFSEGNKACYGPS